MSPAAYGGVACPKPVKRSTLTARAKRAHRLDVAAVRQYIFARERGLCRCCRCRPAESMHEIRPRSLGGKVSRANSVALCGSGTTGCHGYCQSHQIEVNRGLPGAEGLLLFRALTKPAAECMKVAVGQSIESWPMIVIERDV